MNKQDKKFVNRLRGLIDGRETVMIGVASVSGLLAIIDRLDAENKKLKETLKIEDDYAHRCAGWQGVD